MPRHYPERPIVAVGVIVWRDSDVLLVRRGKAPVNASWSIPGGAQEVGETLKETALRELYEETAIRAEITGLADAVDFIDYDDRGDIRHHYTLVDYAALWRSGTPVAGDDVTAARFVSYDDLDDFELWDETRRVIDLSRRMTGNAGIDDVSP